MTASLAVYRRIDPWWPFRTWVQVQDGPEVYTHGGKSHVLQVAPGAHRVSASLFGWAAVPVDISVPDDTVVRVRVRIRAGWVLSLRAKRRPFETLAIEVV